MSNYTNNLFDPESKNNAWVYLFDYVPAKTRVLDVGCSSGNFGEVLINEKNCEVVGLDIDAPDVAKAKKKLTAADVRNIETDDIKDLGMFDVIVFADVLEHLLQPAAALEKVKKQLKKGGRIVFSIPNMSHVYVRLQIMEGFLEYTPIGVLDRTHLHYYDEIEVKQLFADAQLKIRAMRPPTWTYPVSRLSERLLMIGLAIHNQEKFMAQLDKTKANVWQFVGYALPTAEKITVKHRIHYDNPPEELHYTIEARDHELQLLGARLRQLEAENQRMKEFYDNPVKGGLKRAARRVRRATKKTEE